MAQGGVENSRRGKRKEEKNTGVGVGVPGLGGGRLVVAAAVPSVPGVVPVRPVPAVSPPLPAVPPGLSAAAGASPGPLTAWEGAVSSPVR